MVSLPPTEPGLFADPRIIVDLPAPGQPHVIVRTDAAIPVGALERDGIADLYREHGAILFRGFTLGLAGFHDFTRQFCSASVWNESPGRETLDAATNIQSVNLGTRPFPLHPELSREPWKPDACFFHCLTPPASGDGMTTICDGIAIVEALPPPVREGLASRRLLYIQMAAPEELRLWLGTDQPTADQLRDPPPGCPYRFARARGQVVRMFSRPALHRPMFDPRPAFGNFLLFARYMNGRYNFPVFEDGTPVPADWTDIVRDVAAEFTVPIHWQAGDLVMLDNTRFMHGRTEIVDPSERMIASYFGYLDFAVPDPEEPADPVWRRTDFRPAVQTVIRPRPQGVGNRPVSRPE